MFWCYYFIVLLLYFCRNSVRTVFLFNTSDLSTPISEISTNISPATLFPFYDQDTKLLYLTGKVQGLYFLNSLLIYVFSLCLG